MIAPALRLAVALLRRRAALLSALALGALGALGGLVPLLDVPGYEVGLAGAWLSLLLAGPLGLAAARTERARASAGGTGGAGGPGTAALAAALASTALLAVLFAAVALRAALGPCRALAGAAFFPLLALPSAWLSAALAASGAWWTRGRAGPTALLLGGAVLGSLAWTLWTAWSGPAAFALDHLLGVWPGPIYDEALALDARLLLFRGQTAALAVAVGAGAALAKWPREDARVAGRSAALLALAVLAAGSLRVELGRRVLDGDRERIARALGGRRDGPACTVLFPAEKPAAAADALLADCEFHAADVAAALGLAAPPRVTVFVHRSDAEKRNHVGAGATSYTKPWLREIQLSDSAQPHPILRHELVHAVAAALDPGWLGVPARAGVLVSMGLVEGLAVALELPRGQWTLHQWTRAARDLGFMPDVAGAMGPAGFWKAAPARAYGAAGSFLAFLLERHGAGPVAVLYRTGDFQAAFGRPVEALVKDWQAFLDGQAVPRGLRNAAQARYARPPMFQVPCAREVAALEERAWREAGAGRTAQACADLRRVASLTGRASALRGVGDLLARAGDLDGAEAAYREATPAVPEGDGLQKAMLVAAIADLHWRRDEPGAAAAGYFQALAVQPDRPEARLLQAKLTALADPALAVQARPWLLGLEPQATALGRLEKLDHPLARYLLARVHLSRGEAAAAVPLLEAAVAGRLPPVLADEARFLLGEASCDAGRVEAGRAVLAALARAATGGEAPEGPAPTEADRLRAEAGLRRCGFQAAAAGRAPGPAVSAPAAGR